MNEKHEKVSWRKALTGRDMVFCVALTCIIRIIYALVRGRDMVDAIGVSVVSLVVAFFVYLVFNLKGTEG